MKNEIIRKHTLQNKRKMRVRKQLNGTANKPRLCVIKSNKHVHAQLIDDESGKTLASIGTFSKQFKGTEFAKKGKESAKRLGQEVATQASKLNIKEIIFDRGPFKYHGILAELANAAREGGLQF